MAGLKVVHSSGTATMDTHTAAWKTLLQVRAPTNQRILLQSVSITTQAESGEPMLYRIVRQASLVTGQGATGTLTGTFRNVLDSSNDETPQSTGVVGAAAGANGTEVAASAIVWEAGIAVPSGGAQQGLNIPIPGGGFVAIQVYNPETAIACTCTALVEE